MNKSELKQLIKEVMAEEFKNPHGDVPFKSQWGDTPQEILGNVMTTLENDVEWPLTEILDYTEVQKLLWPIRNKIKETLKEIEQR